METAGVSLGPTFDVTAYTDAHYRPAAEIEAMNTAARSITRMGLHKRGTYEFDVAQANDYRTVFAVSFYSEKWACLCHGNPSTLAWGPDAIEIAAGMKEASPCLSSRLRTS